MSCCLVCCAAAFLAWHSGRYDRKRPRRRGTGKAPAGSCAARNPEEKVTFAATHKPSNMLMLALSGALSLSTPASDHERPGHVRTPSQVAVHSVVQLQSTSAAGASRSHTLIT